MRHRPLGRRLGATFTAECKLQTVVYDIPQEAGVGKRCSECERSALWDTGIVITSLRDWDSNDVTERLSQRGG